MPQPEEGPIVVPRMFRTSNKIVIDYPGLLPRIFRQPDVDPRTFIMARLEIIETILSTQPLNLVAPVRILDAEGGNIVFEVNESGDLSIKGRMMKR